MIFNKDNSGKNLAPPSSIEGKRRLAAWSQKMRAAHESRVADKRARKSRPRVGFGFGIRLAELSHAFAFFGVLAVVTDKIWLAATAALAMFYIKRAGRIHHENEESNHGR